MLILFVLHFNNLSVDFSCDLADKLLNQTVSRLEKIQKRVDYHHPFIMFYVVSPHELQSV